MKRLLAILVVLIACGDSSPSGPAVPHKVAAPHVITSQGNGCCKAPYDGCWRVEAYTCTRGHKCLIRLSCLSGGGAHSFNPEWCEYGISQTLVITATARCSEGVDSPETRFQTKIH